MRAALVRPEGPVQLVEMPAEPGAMQRWLHEQIGELLDWTRLAAWSQRGLSVQMVANDFFTGLPDNATATRLYDPADLIGHRIAGPIVAHAANEEGDTVALPDEVIDAWLDAGIPVTGRTTS